MYSALTSANLLLREPLLKGSVVKRYKHSGQDKTAPFLRYEFYSRSRCHDVMFEIIFSPSIEVGYVMIGSGAGP